MDLLCFDGVDIYTEFDPSQILMRGYDYLVYDSGLTTRMDMQRFLSRDVIIICAGSSPWEMPYLRSLLRQPGIQEHPNIHFAFSFSDPGIERVIRHFMGRYADRCHFVQYTPGFCGWREGLQLCFQNKLQSSIMAYFTSYSPFHSRSEKKWSCRENWNARKRMIRRQL